MSDHEMKILANAGGGDVDISCLCGWMKRVTDEKFAEPVFTRHLRLNLIPPYHEKDQFKKGTNG